MLLRWPRAYDQLKEKCLRERGWLMPPVFVGSATYASVNYEKQLYALKNDVPGLMFASSHEDSQELELRVGHVLNTCPFVQIDRMVKLIPGKKIVGDQEITQRMQPLLAAMFPASG